ncbi:MAG: hypothetical protein II179_01630 [Alphaproteobacteria bacterium]|nr:hypothetical protein [Alphaproteobacteria bacterium]
MQDYSYQNIFDTLNSTKQTKSIAREYITPSLWPKKIPNQTTTANTGTDVWLLTDVLGTVKNLETKDYQSSSTIGNILREYAPANMLPNQKFELVDNHMHIIKVTDESMTAEISRYAAWAIMKEIGKHNNTTFHQEYFMYPNQESNAIVARVNEISRIDAREKVKTYKKKIDGILGTLINQNYQFGKFYILLYTWLFPKEYNSDNNLQNYSHITDYMNHKLLPLYANALENIVNRYNNSQNKTYNNLYTISLNEMLSIRKHFADAHDSPKQNLSFTPVKNVIADRTKREQTFINKYIHEKVR